jgi:hypothetical protein
MGAPDGYNPREILYRIGTFFLLLGIGFFLLFLISEAAQQAVLNFFCGSLVFLILGFILRAQVKRAVKPSGRFGILKRMTPKSKQDQGKKK